MDVVENAADTSWALRGREDDGALVVATPGAATVQDGQVSILIGGRASGKPGHDPNPDRDVAAGLAGAVEHHEVLGEHDLARVGSRDDGA